MAADPAPFNQAITEVALAHQLLSEFTALVAVDSASTRPADQSVQGSLVGNELPLGMQLPQGASGWKVSLLLALLLSLLAIWIGGYKRGH